MSGIYGRGKFFLQKWGVVWDPSIPWELVKLSFVVDWVLPVGKWLTKFRIDLFDVFISAKSAGYGTRAGLKAALYVKGPADAEFSLTPVGHLAYSWYQRTACDPALTPKTLTWGSLTMTKVASAASLMWSFSRNSRRAPPTARFFIAGKAYKIRNKS